MNLMIPYYATWLLINNKLTKDMPKDLIVTKGSSNSGTRPTSRI